jgi:hypothetical protein
MNSEEEKDEEARIRQALRAATANRDFSHRGR